MPGYFDEDDYDLRNDYDLQDEYDSLQNDYYKAHRRLHNLNKILKTIDTDYRVDPRHPGYHLIPTETFMMLVQLGMTDD